MWSNGPLLLLRVKLRHGRRTFRFLLGVAGYAVSGWLLSWEPILEWLPGKRAEKLRNAQESLLSLLGILAQSTPELSADFEPRGKATQISVRLWNPLQKSKTGEENEA